MNTSSVLFFVDFVKDVLDHLLPRDVALGGDVGWQVRGASSLQPQQRRIADALTAHPVDGARVFHHDDIVHAS